MSTLQIVGRRSSLYTRMPVILAEELAVEYELVPIHDMTAAAAEVYAGNPALKLPILREQETVLFGALNMCRAIAERSASSRRIVWPEALTDDVSRNAQELVWHCMATQVQLVMGTVINRLPADNPYFTKARSSFEGSLRWLDAHLGTALRALPPRDVSILEVSLHCLVEHLVFRPTLALDPYPSLLAFSKEFAKRPSAEATVYRFDAPPSA